MYKYKQTTDVKVNDLVVWTDISKYHGTLTKDKVYQVTNHPDQNTLNVINDKGNKNSYGKGFGFKVIQTKPASEAVVGDYMYRITSGSDAFPQHTIIKITKITPNYLYYKAGQSVLHDEVIVIAQTEQTSEYPVFKEDKVLGFIFKYTGPNEGIYLTNKGIPKRKPGDYSSTMLPSHRDCWKPCDFTIQPDIEDIDWWQARYEAGLPIYATSIFGRAFLCKATPPKEWVGNDAFSMTDPSLAQQAPTIPESAISFALYPSGAPSEPTQTTTKEQPMNKTTLKLLLELLGKDATNSKFVGIITNEDEYIGYMYFDSKEDATECMAQPRMELHKLHLFEKSCVLAQKPRKVIEV